MIPLKKYLENLPHHIEMFMCKRLIKKSNCLVKEDARKYLEVLASGSFDEEHLNRYEFSVRNGIFALKEAEYSRKKCESMHTGDYWKRTAKVHDEIAGLF